ncbi:hypothetical protein, partial [Escherichia coli]|uniref:hypothetical protein n=1 Tax=Escherichia coli TaxID=562 RepID=UPI002117B894
GEGLEVKLVRVGRETNWMANIDVLAQNFFDSTFRFDAVTTNEAANWTFTKMAQDEVGNILLNADAVANSYEQYDNQHN